MRFKIIGSGGCVSTPKPTCQCRICSEAREKGFPYARCGCSLYVEDINVLIDTPEDIAHALNNSNIEAVDYIFYSHIDPDHTMGMHAPCDVKPFPINTVFKDADCLIIGNTIIGGVLKDGFILDNNNVLRNELFCNG